MPIKHAFPPAILSQANTGALAQLFEDKLPHTLVTGDRRKLLSKAIMGLPLS